MLNENERENPYEKLEAAVDNLTKCINALALKCEELQDTIDDIFADDIRLM